MNALNKLLVIYVSNCVFVHLFFTHLRKYVARTCSGGLSTNELYGPNAECLRRVGMGGEGVLV